MARRRTFADLRRNGRRVRHGSVRLNYLAMETAKPQVAFAIGRSFGNAVQRNRARRRLRAAFVDAYGGPEPDRHHRFGQLKGAFLLTGNHGLLHSGYRQLVTDVESCLAKLGSSART